VHEGINATLVGLKALSFFSTGGEISKNKAVLSLRAETEKLKVDALFNEAFLIFSIDHITNSKEE